MDFYGLKTCDTCRKAEKALRAAGHAPNVIDVRADGVPADTLAGFWQSVGESLMNTRSTTWRGLSETDRAGDPLALLVEHPTLMKRPVIVHEGTTYVGWTKEVQAALL
ncbi:MAG: ArsC/Spx/MgsR family protein [Pseudomonadota bacterium]